MCDYIRPRVQGSDCMCGWGVYYRGMTVDMTQVWDWSVTAGASVTVGMPICTCVAEWLGGVDSDMALAWL